MTSGFVSPKNIHRAKIVEVSPEDNSEVLRQLFFLKAPTREVNRVGGKQIFCIDQREWS